MTPPTRRAVAPCGGALRAVRGPELLPFLMAGLVCVIGGGLVAAVTAPTASEHSSWAAAYLVLVGGVAQAGLGLGQALFAAPTGPGVTATEVAGWNLGNAAVLVGTLLNLTPLVDVGGALLVVTLALLARGLRPSSTVPVHGARRYWLHAYRLLVVILLVSIPVGLVLVRVRNP